MAAQETRAEAAERLRELVDRDERRLAEERSRRGEGAPLPEQLERVQEPGRLVGRQVQRGDFRLVVRPLAA